MRLFLALLIVLLVADRIGQQRYIEFEGLPKVVPDILVPLQGVRKNEENEFRCVSSSRYFRHDVCCFGSTY